MLRIVKRPVQILKTHVESCGFGLNKICLGFGDCGFLSRGAECWFFDSVYSRTASICGGWQVLMYVDCICLGFCRCAAGPRDCSFRSFRYCLIMQETVGKGQRNWLVLRVGFIGFGEFWW